MTENKDTKMNTVTDPLTCANSIPPVAIALDLGLLLQIFTSSIHTSYCLTAIKSWRFIGRRAKIQHDSIGVKHYYPSDSLLQEKPMPAKRVIRKVYAVFQG